MNLPTRKKSGFTLVEMTVVIVFGMALASAGLMLLQQQIQTARLFNQQDFILTEAPQINNSLGAILGRADAIRLHANFADAVNNVNPTTTGATTLVASFRNFDNTFILGYISLETVSGNPQLNYYFEDPNLTPRAAPAQATPAWVISRKTQNVNFNLVNGLFQLTLTGPASEQITYTISPNQ